jgi:hypothetical protein
MQFFIRTATRSAGGGVICIPMAAAALPATETRSCTRAFSAVTYKIVPNGT